MIKSRSFEGTNKTRLSSVLLEEVPSHHYTIMVVKDSIKMAGLAGFEPAHDGTKNRCLTAWL